MNLDRELIVRAQRDDTIAQEELVRAPGADGIPGGQPILPDPRGRRGSGARGFFRFSNKIQQIRPADNVRGWVSRVAINVCYDRLRKLRREKAAIEGLSAEPVAPQRPDPDAYEAEVEAVDTFIDLGTGTIAMPAA